MSDRNAPLERPPADGSPTPDASDSNYQAAQTAIAGFWQTALTNEESRFNNLNTRGVAVLTIAGLVTGIAGFFVKDIDTPSPNPLGGTRAWVAGCVAATVVVLTLMALIVIAKVLYPKRRALFDDPETTGYPWNDLRNTVEVDAVVLPRLQEVAGVLRRRNESKGIWLQWAYVCVGVAVLLISAAAVIVAGHDISVS